MSSNLDKISLTQAIMESMALRKDRYLCALPKAPSGSYPYGIHDIIVVEAPSEIEAIEAAKRVWKGKKVGSDRELEGVTATLFEDLVLGWSYYFFYCP